MRFGILGPLELWRDGHLATLAPKQRVVLAALLLRANQVASAEWLIEQVWGERPPVTATKTLHTLVTRLRRVLPAGSLVTRAPGYLLQVAPDDLDLHCFHRLSREAAAAADQGAHARAAERLHAALALWRGPALADVDSEALRRGDARGLEELRLATLEARIDADLRLGRHGELVAELTGLVTSHPLRERFHAGLMVALYRTGRQVEALAVYRELRGRLVEELGLEPGRALQALQRQILARDPDLDLPVAPADGTPATVTPIVPRQLPPDPASFTGRGPELAEVEHRLTAADHNATIVISAIDGVGGVGKSALAIHAAHRLAGRFPDGQLYVNLHGATAGLTPLAPLEVLGRFLRALGMDGGQVPTELDEAAARFRSEVAARRLLVVLDNARDAAQVAPLLPGTPGSAVLVTSRQTLAGLDGAPWVLHLDVLSPQEAVELLGRLAGPRRVAAEPEPAAEVARLCGYLPLALRIAGSRLAARPTWPVRALADRLANASARLDELELANLGIRASVGVSYQQLQHSPDPTDRNAAAALPLLGFLDGPDIGIAAAACLLDRSEAETVRVLERLVDAQLLETPTPGRYRMHDLLRLYARERGAEERSEAERTAALTRVLGFYTASVSNAVSLIHPGDRDTAAEVGEAEGGLGFTHPAGALSWLDAELANLVAAIEQAAATAGAPASLILQLPHTLQVFFHIRGFWGEWERVNQVALGAARRARDRAAEVLVLGDLGNAYWFLGRDDDASACFRRSLAACQELGDRAGLARNLNGLAVVGIRGRRYDEALVWLQESVAVRRQLGDREGLSTTLTNLGIVHQRQGRYDDAVACLEEAMSICEQFGDTRSWALDLHSLGNVYELQGRYDEALASQRTCLDTARELRYDWLEAKILGSLGVVCERLGRPDESLAHQREGLALHRKLGDRHSQAENLQQLGLTLRALGRDQDALAHWDEALAIFDDLRNPAADEVRVLIDELRSVME
jgi:DNA-binding SARP family transcriptional activator/tetratricopeptide (TPR) repeat protein